MNAYAGLVYMVEHVSTKMGSAIDHQHLPPRIGQGPRDYRTSETRTHD